MFTHNKRTKIDHKPGYTGVDNWGFPKINPTTGCSSFGIATVQSWLYLVPQEDVKREWRALRGKGSNKLVDCGDQQVSVNGVLRDDEDLEGPNRLHDYLAAFGVWNCCNNAMGCKAGGKGTVSVPWK